MPDPSPRRTWRQRLRFRLSVRALMVLVLVLGGWLGWVVHRARVQLEVVAAIKRAGGEVFYDWEHELDTVPKRTIWAPRWLVDSLGKDYFSSVSHVRFREPGADDVAGQLARLPGLESAVFDLSDLSDSGLARLRGLNLRYLSLHGAKVTDAGLHDVRGLTNLKDLDLSSTSVGDAGMAQIATLPKLAYLKVYNTNVTDLGVGSIVKLPALDRLDLSATSVGDQGAALLASKAGLGHIDLQQTRVSFAAIQALRAALPDAQIYYPSLPQSVPDRP